MLLPPLQEANLSPMRYLRDDVATCTMLRQRGAGCERNPRLVCAYASEAQSVQSATNNDALQVLG